MPYLEEPRVQCASVLPRSRSLDMAVTGDSGKKKRGGKVFGSLERGLDKMINMLTPSKKRGLRDGPRKIRVPEVTWCLLSSAQHGLNKWFFSFAAAVQCYSDQSGQPRPGSEPDPLHPTREKRRFHTERVRLSPPVGRSALEPRRHHLLCSSLKVYPQMSDQGWLWEGNHGVWAGGVPPAEARGRGSPQAEAEGRCLGL